MTVERNDDDLPEQPEQPERSEDFEGDGAAGAGRVPVALAATEEPVALRVGLVEDERTPEGMVCMGTFRNDRLIARCVLPPEAWEELEESEIFAEPVAVVLVAQEAPPGLQCRLFAMIELPDEIDEDEEDEDSEPWAASVPGAGYEAAVAEAEADADGEEEDDEDEDEDATRVVPLPLGNIVRYDRDRLFPDSLPREAMDILQKVIDGRTSEVVDRALADLLGL